MYYYTYYYETYSHVLVTRMYYTCVYYFLCVRGGREVLGSSLSLSLATCTLFFCSGARDNLGIKSSPLLELPPRQRSYVSLQSACIHISPTPTPADSSFPRVKTPDYLLQTSQPRQSLAFSTTFSTLLVTGAREKCLRPPQVALMGTNPGGVAPEWKPLV